MDFGGAVLNRGIIVPQPVYKATTQFSPLPSIRFSDNGLPGINLDRALKKQLSSVSNRDWAPTVSTTAKKVTIRINVSATMGSGRMY